MTFSPTASSSAGSYQDDPDTNGPQHVTILYASETGNAQDTAERVGREFRRLGRRCVIMSMDMFDVFDLPDTQLLILITSTHGRGDPPPQMQSLWTALLRQSLPKDILEDVNYALYGLGDSSYEKFCYAGKMLARRMDGLGARKTGEPAWGDERAPDGIEETFLPWLEQTVREILPYLPPVDFGFEPIPNSELPPPIFELCPVQIDTGMDRLSLSPGLNGYGSGNTNGNSNVDGDTKVNGNINGNGEVKSNGNGDDPGSGHRDQDGSSNVIGSLNGESSTIRSEEPPTEAAPARSIDTVHGNLTEVWKPDDWIWVKLVENKRVTKKGWFQDVRQFELGIEDPDFDGYAPGSICELQPRTSEQEVLDFLELSGLQERADEPFCIRSIPPDQPLPPHLPPLELPTTLRSLLTNHLNLRSSPRKSFFEWLRRLSPDEREKERLDEFLSDPDEIHTYATRPSRTILETLADFRETRIPLSHLLEILPPLRRRQFSIASSWEKHPGKVQLLVALVEYRTNLKVVRKGLCSSWLDRLPIGTRLPIKISPPTLHLPPSPSTPVILIGPGTGVAPIRAFLESRLAQRAENTILYFGCRRRDTDCYYAEEWEEYRKKGFRVEVAFSREGEEKVYVQDSIRRDKVLVREWVVQRGGWVYISGSSNAMPREVREAIAWCISKDGAGDLEEQEAKEYVEELFDSGRGGEESW